MLESAEARYRRLCRAIEGQSLPLALVDLDALDRNADALFAPVRRANKRLRIASKSIRCLWLIQYLIDRSDGLIEGVMAYAAQEAEHLVDAGLRDVLVAYPTVQPADVRALHRAHEKGGAVSVVVDSIEQLERLQPQAEALGFVLSVVVEVDMSFRPLGDALHVGVRRSPLREPSEVLALVQTIGSLSNLRFAGVMGYEAQIAGVTDDNPFSPLLNAPKRLLKDLSKPPVRKTRQAIAEGLARMGLGGGLFNGGGTGSLAWSSDEDALTEVTVGSGFLDSHLFDYYRGLELEAAAMFALQVVRRPGRSMVTCHGGGYVASGEPGQDRLPIPFLPRGASLMRLEGAGEVQTPVVLPEGVRLEIGAPMFFRHAKAGELAEHFVEYKMVRNDAIEAVAPTYRGAGWCFL